MEKWSKIVMIGHFFLCVWQCDFNIWTREAGAGNLGIAIEGPSKAAISFKDHKDGSCFATYKVTEAGKLV